EGAFTELTNVLLRMKDLATEAYNASTTADDKAALQAEYDALGSELANIMTTSSFGGQTLFGLDGASGLLGAAAGITFQIGATAAETMNVNTAASLNDATSGLVAALQGVSAFYAAAAPA